jgi:hypothetical protein
VICHSIADILVVEDAEQSRPFGLLAGDQADHHLAVGGIERRRRLIEQQDRMVGDETTGDVDPLLFAARKRRWRQRPEFFRQVEFGKQLPRPLMRGLLGDPADSSGSAATSSADTRGTARRNWLT